MQEEAAQPARRLLLLSTPAVDVPLLRAGLQAVWSEGFTAVAAKTQGSAPGAVYADAQGARWMGKPGSYDNKTTTDTAHGSQLRRGYSRDAVKEKVVADCFVTLQVAMGHARSFETPVVQLARMPFLNQFTESNIFLQDMAQNVRSHDQRHVHVLSRLVSGYHDLKCAHVAHAASPSGSRSLLEHLQAGAAVPTHILVEGREVELRGLVPLLAAARLLMDIDVLGDSCSNAGFVLRADTAAGIARYAQVVKVDPGFAFSFESSQNLLLLGAAPWSSRRLADSKDVQVGANGLVVTWAQLSAAQKTVFSDCVRLGACCLQREVLLFLLQREGAFTQGAQEELLRPELRERYVQFVEQNARFQLSMYCV